MIGVIAQAEESAEGSQPSKWSLWFLKRQGSVRPEGQVEFRESLRGLGLTRLLG